MGGCNVPHPHHRSVGRTAASPGKSARASRGGAGRRLLDPLRDRLFRTHADVVLVGAVLAWHRARAVSAAGAGDAHAGGQGGGERLLGEAEPHDETHGHAPEVLAVLFPWFAEIVGVVAYYLLSRYAHAIPYTAVMFVVGALIGVLVHHANLGNLLSSAQTWIGINGEVILLVFLPGLLYLDSYNIDVHLFAASFFQLLLFAFPMVLAGTTLTALVAKFVLPYDWSFDLCMTFGSILAATDPVAVAVLLNELGAPPRLKVRDCCCVSSRSLERGGESVCVSAPFPLGEAVCTMLCANVRGHCNPNPRHATRCVLGFRLFSRGATYIRNYHFHSLRCASSSLQMHVSGESLLNDGSAVVFYYIFSQRFLYELDVSGVGEDVRPFRSPALGPFQLV